MWRLIAATLTLVLLPQASYCRSFYEDESLRQRGWLWFEEHERQSKQGNTKEPEEEVMTPAKAKRQIEQFKRELDDLRYVMLASPTPENIKAYRDKEAVMWDQAMELHKAWDLANLLYPEQRDLINNPVNVHAVKAQREMIRQDNSKKIEQFAKKYELVLFFSSECNYCKLLAPVLKAFSEKYGFTVSSVSSDGQQHEYFKTAYIPQLTQKLGITSFPTIIAISNDASTAFELIRGYVSISEIEDYTMLAINYLEKEGKTQDNDKLTKQLR
jgi:conjugal transfer pilus assembly protein TraF